MQYVIIFSIALILHGVYKWHVANLIAKTPNITNTQVKALRDIAIKSKLLRIKTQ